MRSVTVFSSNVMLAIAIGALVAGLLCVFASLMLFGPRGVLARRRQSGPEVVETTTVKQLAQRHPVAVIAGLSVPLLLGLGYGLSTGSLSARSHPLVVCAYLMATAFVVMTIWKVVSIRTKG